MYYVILAPVLFILFLMTVDIILMTFPKPDLKAEAYPGEYQIKKTNRIEFQTSSECAAFSTAYVMRHFGMEAGGMELYADFPNKNKSGLVYARGIRAYLKQRGFQSCYYKGNISSLKKQVSKGTPVIVFIKTFANQRYLHYVSVTGYDTDNIYLAESLALLVNCRSEDVNGNYNRKIPIDEFRKLWCIRDFRMPFYNYTYITTKSRSESNL